MQEALTAEVLTEEVSTKLILPKGMRFLTFGEKLSDRLLGHGSHNWGFPITLKGVEYPSQYSSHQSCTECGRTQLFNSREMLAGPQICIAVK